MAHILVIDDDAEIRATLEQSLTMAGHTVILAEDGGQGLRLHRAEPACLVITDIYMPKMEGMETIMTFRKNFPNVPIIAMSGRPKAGNVLEVARRLGAVKILPKPFQPHELLAVVEEALRQNPDGPVPGED